jgi:hypothetical protein
VGLGASAGSTRLFTLVSRILPERTPKSVKGKSPLWEEIFVELDAPR